MKNVSFRSFYSLLAGVLLIHSCKKDIQVLNTSNFRSTLTGKGFIRSLNTTFGSISRDEWDNVTGNDVNNIPVSSTPAISDQLTSLNGALDKGSNYGERIRGYIYPPSTGNYTFWIAADDSGELWLSTDDNAANKAKIASVVSWTPYQQWNIYPSQKSASVYLEANHKYYIEILHKQGGGGGNLSVQWMLPDNSFETPIPGSRLSPYINASASVTGTILREEWDNVIGNDVANIPVQTAPALSNQITALEGPLNTGYNYGERIRGYIHAPLTGNYTFWIAADDAGELWLSTDDDPAKKVKIAGNLSWTGYREWNIFPSQRSATVSLQANHKYYIEVLHKQGQGGANLSVQWMLPNNTVEMPIPGNRLSPYVSVAASAAPTSDYTASAAINLNGAHDITISGKTISGANVPAINLTNCYNIHITKNRLLNSKDVGIHLYNCKNITIDYNYFTNVSSGVYAEQTSGGGIIVNNNQFLNMQGPFPRGQFVQFNNVSGPNSSISFNQGENILGQSYAEDAISLYQSSGTSDSPISIAGNWIRGGGPSSSGGGIMLGDNGGSYLTAANNILVDPGEYGMAIAGGDHNSLINNKIYGKSQPFTNVGLYVNAVNGHTVTNARVTGNQINFFNASNYNNNWWLAPGVQKPAGWDDGGNILGAPINAAILPAVIITSK